MTQLKPHESAADKPKAAIVVGANGAIGSAVVAALSADGGVDCVYAISREPRLETAHPKVRLLQSDSSEASIVRVIEHIRSAVDGEALNIETIVVASGLLHDTTLEPEKRLEQLSSEQTMRVFEVNTLMPMLWMQGFSRLFSKRHAAKIAVLSARVGSITDNRLGGWYTYRSSKAALNMMLKTLAIEFARRFPGIKVCAFHPGTTRSPLSEPFRGRLPEEKIFEPEFVAQRLLLSLQQLRADGELSFIDWDHKSIEW
jgi:NAD(P)-dependent dehydrogenase (short-subunit alcohol dehydrogenase family)